ncbi:MAG: hypothetical protein LBS54_09350, partial [Dysgonamonadaceae bacterium]|nr:hypothetical protein [Dysgonamonadaceae bacterium]
ISIYNLENKQICVLWKKENLKFPVTDEKWYNKYQEIIEQLIAILSEGDINAVKEYIKNLK